MDESLVTKYPDLERRHFWWAIRRQLVLKMFNDWFPHGSARVLDVGCGSGVTADAVARQGAEVVGVDLEVPATSSTTSRPHLIAGDYFEIGPGLGEFDLVLAMDVIEHFEDDERVLKGLFANTRIGGKAVITVPAYDWLWSSHDEQNEHFRRYTRRELREKMVSAGFQVDRIGYLFLGLVPPKLALMIIERAGSRSAPTGTGVVGPMNAVAFAYFKLETNLALRLHNFLPMGSSVVAVGTRLNGDDGQSAKRNDH